MLNHISQKLLLVFTMKDPSLPLVWAFLMAAIIAFGSFLLLGIPGAVVMESAKWLMNKMGRTVPPFNEASWGTAIALSLICPLGIPLAHWLATFGLPRSWLSLLGVWGLWTAVLGLLMTAVPAK